MAAARLFVALLLLTVATAGFAQADEGRALDITTATNVPRKVLNGGSDGLLASVANQAVSALQGALEVIESALNLNAPVLAASNGVEQLSGYDNFKKLINSGKKVVIFFTAEWCAPCKFVGPAFRMLSNMPAYDTLAFYTVDVDAEPDISKDVGIRPNAMPTFTAFKDGSKIDEFVGANLNGVQIMLARFARL